CSVDAILVSLEWPLARRNSKRTGFSPLSQQSIGGRLWHRRTCHAGQTGGTMLPTSSWANRNMAPLLRINDLRTSFLTSAGEERAVDGVSFDIEAGQTVGLVGESGCGKSVTALSIVRLLAKSTGRIAGGEILYRGTDLAKLPEPEMRRIRGNEISMIFQEPM